jgi:hypothetical protein
LSNTDQASLSHSPKGTDRASYLRAKRRLGALIGFYIHLFVFLLVVTILAAVNWLTGGPWWVLGVFFGWGIFVLAHGLVVTGRSPGAFARWRQRKIRQFMDEDRGGPSSR